MNRFAAFSVISLVTAGAFFSACSDDANPEPSEPEGGTGGKHSTGGRGNGGGGGDEDGGGTGAKPSTGGKGGGTGGAGTGNTSGTLDGGGGPDSGSGGGGGSGGTGPDNDSGTGGTGGGGAMCTENPNTACIECPTSDKEFLNGCTKSKCTKFTATLEKIGSNGQRPPLP